MAKLSDSVRKKFILIIVYIGLLLDYALLTSVEPILPAFFLQENSSNGTLVEIGTESRHDQISQEDTRLGILVGMKCLVQVFIQPLIGPLTTRIGFSIPLFSGFIVLISSTILFAYGESYAVLFVARSVQGIGSACVATAGRSFDYSRAGLGMGLLAQQYSDDNERAHYMGIAMGGMALGLLIGPPYGGAMFDLFHGKELCFLILAGIGVIGAALQLFAVPPRIQFAQKVSKSTSLTNLLKDPKILIATGSIVVANLGFGVLIPGLTLWMVEKWNSNAFELGIIFLPSSIAYLIGTYFLPSLTIKIGRWLCALISLPIIAVCLATTSLAPSIIILVVPITVIGICISFVDSAMVPLLGQLAYQKHQLEKRLSSEASPLISSSRSANSSDDSEIDATYTANAYAISDAGLSIAYFVAPIVSGPLVGAIGYPWMTWSFAIFVAAYAPLSIFLRGTSGSGRNRNLSLSHLR